jgi:tetratricopeptide (TPR) repeat protein
MRAHLLLAAMFAVTAPLTAQQSIADLIARGDSARAELHSDAALRHYQEAIKLGEAAVGTQLEEVAGVTTPNPLLYTALWKGAREIADVAKQLLGDSLKQQRDSLYSIGRTWAEAAIKLDSADAEGHFALALVLGRLSRTRGGKERVRFAKIIFDEAQRAIQLNPRHDGAYHILGMWNAEVKRLSGLTRFFAKTLFGAGFMDRASWDSAVVDMQRAVSLNPQHVYHRLELAGVYLDVGAIDKATEQLQAIATLPIGDPMDPYYKEHAAMALADIRDGNPNDAKDLLRKG